MYERFASLLGHAQASTTLDIYAHAFDKTNARHRKSWEGDWIMKNQADTSEQSILLKALGDHYYLQRAMNTGWRETGYLILKVDSLLVGKKAVFPSEEVCLARNAVNQLRNKKIKQGSTQTPLMICC